MIRHPIPPVYDSRSKILILGSFPSVRSREQNFFYGHPQNRFWRLLAALLQEAEPKTVEEKKAFLLDHGIALWDVIASCELTGSADSSIKNVVPNDLTPIFAAAKIETIYLNGKTAQKVFDRFLRDQTTIPTVCLPSTSPANAAWDMDRLIGSWRVILAKIKK